MATCIHGWGSDGMTPSGCPQCAELGHQRDREELDRLRKREAELQRENARLRDELAKERTAHTATRSSLNDALDNPIFED
jgi:hypothetical protein